MFGHYTYSANIKDNKVIGFVIDYNKNNTIDIYNYKTNNSETPNFNTIAYILSTIPLTCNNNITFLEMLDNNLDNSKKVYADKILLELQLNSSNELIDKFGSSLINISSNNNVFFGFPDSYIYAALQFIMNNNIDAFVKYKELKWHTK